MSILVDTSVWSLALLRKKISRHSKVDQLTDLILQDQPIYLLGIILQEILQGCRTNEQLLKLKRHLDSFPILPLQRDDYAYAAELGITCRRKGVQAGAIDFLIAAAAIRYDCRLLTADGDFERIAVNSALRLI